MYDEQSAHEDLHLCVDNRYHVFDLEPLPAAFRKELVNSPTAKTQNVKN